VEPRDTLNAALERLWGVEARLNSLDELPSCSLASPRDFVVVEPPPERRRGKWLLFLARKEGIDTITLINRAKKLLGAGRASVRGLKDSCSVSYQYVALDAPEAGLHAGEGPLEGPGFKLYYLGTGKPLKPGNLDFNMFLVKLTVSSQETLCSNAERLEYAPGFYGPQRFGIERPNTHILALLAGEGRRGELLREYGFRYPLEERTRPGTYEARALEEAGRTLDPFRLVKHPAVVSEALQSYIFNRALSQAIKDGGLDSYGETAVTVKCRGKTARVPAARLPAPKLRSSKSKWARLVSLIMEEEGLSWRVLEGVKPHVKPLKYPVCVSTCRAASGYSTVAFSLPKGAYATIALREICAVDWISYCRDPSSV
jgi:tRNA(Glu) U13 pseudouridine synthase TruD